MANDLTPIQLLLLRALARRGTGAGPFAIPAWRETAARELAAAGLLLLAPDESLGLAWATLTATGWIVAQNLDGRAVELDARITVGSAVRVDGVDLVERVAGRELRVTRESDRFTFTGGAYGAHSIAADRSITSADRLLAHWRGYVEATAKLALAKIEGAL